MINYYMYRVYLLASRCFRYYKPNNVTYVLYSIFMFSPVIMLMIIIFKNWVKSYVRLLDLVLLAIAFSVVIVKKNISSIGQICFNV